MISFDLGHLCVLLIYIAIKLVRVTQNIYSLRPIKNITCPWKQNFENVFEWANRAKRVKIFSSLESDQMISLFRLSE